MFNAPLQPGTDEESFVRRGPKIARGSILPRVCLMSKNMKSNEFTAERKLSIVVVEGEAHVALVSLELVRVCIDERQESPCTRRSLQLAMETAKRCK